MFAPARTPDAIIGRLNQEVTRVINQPEFKTRLFDLGAEIVGGSPQQLVAVMQGDISRMGKVIRDASIHEE
jgi:tripartite-type tricarboxylate transporter receptor subunit TctC